MNDYREFDLRKVNSSTPRECVIWHRKVKEYANFNIVYNVVCRDCRNNTTARDLKRRG